MMITPLELVIVLSMFMAFFAFMMGIVPASMQFVNAFDFTWFGVGIVGVAGACAVVPIVGLPCAGALGIFGILTVWQYIIVSASWIKLLVFMPLVIGFIFAISQLARGTG